ncbi:lipoprotein [Paenibacillus darwinianus]|uniref:Lipoprotein n=1 Tax=Paenibacillus darwinianus TaxID=1380763 RepID=A0A9W5S0X2_9BACL|nr:DUF6376 family protein [Paenibacillus darwinianus]EXX86949.1 lipoprotein [Paenibacillus darwinianus]EXX87180.1 lipoprotein [Paenibacillus darwinianus]EXX87229.1 lipoprotein [Paenibacillus darwinianus]
MKIRMRVMAAVVLVALLSGCSLLEGVKQIDRTLDYTNEAASYVADAAAWAESIPAMAASAATDPAARDALIRELEGIQSRISQFNGLNAPQAAQKIHEQIVGYNETLQQDIGVYLEKLNGDIQNFDQAYLDSGIDRTLEQLARLIGAVRNLGNE